jgi:hypothetical protein
VAGAQGLTRAFGDGATVTAYHPFDTQDLTLEAPDTFITERCRRRRR